MAHIVQQAPKQNINIRRSNHTTPEGGGPAYVLFPSMLQLNSV